MEPLKNKTCDACRASASLATEEQIALYLPQLPGWQIVEVDGVKRLQKSYRFRNFAQALDFTNRVGAITEEQNHHPQLVTEWGRVTVNWWTHAIGGLHVNDFVMAAKTDEL